MKFLLIATAILLTSPAVAEMRMPEAKAQSLAKDRMVLPADFATSPALVIFTFAQDQFDVIAEMETKLPILATGTDGLAAYNVPVIPNPGAIVRGFIRSGMRGIYETPEDRARTIVLFVDEDEYFPEANFPQTEQPIVALVTQDGGVVASVSGDAGDETIAAITAMLSEAGF